MELFVEVITPQRTLYKGTATQVIVGGQKAPFAILPRHQAIISTLVPKGKLRIDHEDGSSTILNLEGMGTLEMHQDRLTITTEKGTLVEAQEENA